MVPFFSKSSAFMLTQYVFKKHKDFLNKTYGLFEQNIRTFLKNIRLFF